MENDLILIGEAAKILGVCIKTVRSLHKKGMLVPEVHPITKFRIYSRKKLEEFLDEYKDKQA